MQCYVGLCHVILSYAMPRWVTLFYAELCNPTRGYVMLC